MSKLSEQIQEMQRRLTANALDEQAFVKALGEALSEVDQHLLHEVRRLGDEHETRRGHILRELQDMAGRLCMLPGGGGRQPQAIDHREVETHLNRIAPQIQQQANLTRELHNAVNRELQAATINRDRDRDYHQPIGRELPPTHHHANGRDQHSPGDWRRATSAIEDDIDTYWRAPGISH